MEHCEFRLFAALCRFRGRAQLVNPCQDTLAKMTGMARNNVSRAAHGLQDKAWVRLHHKDKNPRKKIENYELLIPIPGSSPGVVPKPKRVRATVCDYAEPDAFIGVDHDNDQYYAVDTDSEPMSEAELDLALARYMSEEA